jgi:hypothetical protein
MRGAVEPDARGRYMERFRHAMALPPHIQLDSQRDLTTHWTSRRRRDRAGPASVGSTARTVASGRQRRMIGVRPAAARRVQRPP